MVVAVMKTMTISEIKYHWTIDQYMNKVRNGDIQANEERIELMNFIDSKLEVENIVIDGEKIEKGIKNIENHFPFKLLDWEIFIFAFVAGVFYADGSLVFNEFLVMMGRGGGKTGFMSAIEWYLSTVQGIPKYHVDIVATSEDQAMESFNEIWEILEGDKKKYKKRFKWTQQKIVFKKTGSVIRFRTNNAKTKDGGRQGAVIFDEVHAYENDASIKVFTSGLGKKKHSRRFYFTTDGDIRDGFLDGLKDEAKMILAGERPLRRTFPFICKIDKLEDALDPKLWEKANPSINHFPDLKLEMLLEFEKLDDRPSARIEFYTKRMNWPLREEFSAVTSWENILATKQETPDLTGLPCIAAIDMSDTLDFVGLGLLFKVGEKYYWKSHTLINKKAMIGRNYKVPIDVGIERNMITIVNNETNTPEDVSKWFIEQTKHYNIKLVTSDLYRVKYLGEEFIKCGFNPLKIARSGTRTHTELQPTIENLFAYQNIVYCDDDFMMRWYTQNTMVVRDGKGNICYEKVEPKLRKTDGFMALIHALQYREELNAPVVTYNRRLKTIVGN